METVCCMCAKKKKGDKWISGPPRPGRAISHGFCPVCFELTIRRIESAASRRQPPQPIAA